MPSSVITGGCASTNFFKATVFPFEVPGEDQHTTCTDKSKHTGIQGIHGDYKADVDQPEQDDNDCQYPPASSYCR